MCKKYFFRVDFPRCPVYIANDWGTDYTYIGDWDYGKFIPRKKPTHYSFNEGGGLHTKYCREATPEEVAIIELEYY